MKYLLILLLISNDCLGQIRYIGTTIKIDTIRPIYSPFRDTIIAGTGVIILDTFVNGRHCYIFTIDTSYQIPKVNFNEYELGDEGGNAKEFHNLLSGVKTEDYDSTYISPSKYYYQPKKDTIPKDTVHTKGIFFKESGRLAIGDGYTGSMHISGIGKRDSGTIHFKNDTIPTKIFYKDGDSIKGGSGTLRFTSELNNETKIDTIPCLLLISDKSEFDYSVVANVEAIKGYQVIKIGRNTIETSYLDAKKKPFGKNIIIWENY